MKNKIKILPIIFALIILLSGCEGATSQDSTPLEDHIPVGAGNPKTDKGRRTYITELCVAEYKIFSGFNDLCLAKDKAICDYEITIYDAQNQDEKIAFIDSNCYSLASFRTGADVRKANRVIKIRDNYLSKVELKMSFEGLEDRTMIMENVKLTSQGEVSCAKIEFCLQEGLYIFLTISGTQVAMTP